MTMKLTMKKFQLVSNYANYLIWDEKQNAPFYWIPFISLTFLKKSAKKFATKNFKKD